MKIRVYNIDQYRQMAKNFNSKQFVEKIEILQRQTGLFCLASDGNWWRVKVLDSEIAEQLEKQGITFDIEQEWGTSEICSLVYLLGIKNDDY